MAINMQRGKLPHIFWIDLKNDGVFVESAVMKKDEFGNVYYFPINSLDSIDKKRLAKIVNNRNAVHFELWDLMSNITLNNGVNALDYFHQLVQVLTPSGRSMRPQEGSIGVGESGSIDTRSKDDRKHMEEEISMAANAAAVAAATAAANAVKNANAPQQVQQVQEKVLSPAEKAAITRAQNKAKKEAETSAE